METAEGPRRRAYDKSVRWLIQNCAEALLQVVRGRRVLHWETISPSLLHLERTRDGLLGALFDGETEPEQTLLAITTYSRTDVGRQCLEDIALAWLALGQAPETVVLVLAERGGPLVTPTSRGEWSLRHTTKIAAELLRGTKVLIESPLIAELAEQWYGDDRRRAVAEARPEAGAEAVVRVLRARFGPPPAEVAEAVRAEQDLARLDDLTEAAALCTDIAEFRARLWPN